MTPRTRGSLILALFTGTGGALVLPVRPLQAQTIDLKDAKTFSDSVRMLAQAQEAATDRILARFNQVDPSAVSIGIIKSIAGQKPATEFFDLRFQFQLRNPADAAKRSPWSLFTLASFDVALSDVPTDASTADQEARRKLTEAGVSLNWGFRPVSQMESVAFKGTDGRDSTRKESVRQRRFFAGIVGKIFDTDPYYGAQVGGIELTGSSFRGSVLSVAYLHRFYPAAGKNTHNLHVEFYLRSHAVDFFKLLSIRGGVLLPVGRGSQGDGVNTRITLEAPLTHRFF